MKKHEQLSSFWFCNEILTGIAQVKYADGTTEHLPLLKGEKFVEKLIEKY